MRSLPILGLAATLFVSPALAQSGGECGCPADTNDDNLVDFADILQILADWECTECPDSDINDDGVVDFADVLDVLADWGCEVTGSTTTISGIVTSALTGDVISGASVLVGPCPFVTNEAGMYEGELPVGGYDVLFEATNYMSREDSIILFPGEPAVLDAQLDPVGPVVVTIVVEDEGEPGGTVVARAEVVVLDGSTVEGFAWTQTVGAEAVLNGADTDTVTLDLATRAEYRDQLIHVLEEPPVDPSDLPPNVEVPPGEFPAGLQDRVQVVGMSPFALEETGVVGLEVEVTTTSGTYHADDDLHTHLPWVPTAGIRNVPIGLPVLLYARDQNTYDWSFGAPGGSGANLLDPTAQNPEFTPDVPGMYRATVTDIAGGPVDLFIFAGNWRGIIVDQDADGRPVTDQLCLNCHFDGGPAADQFTPWARTGHAEIFTNNLNESTHYGEGCFPCHTVGFDLGVVNSGFDDAPDYLAFLTSGLLNNPGDNWTTMLQDYPDAAKLANIQCDNCHGPQNGEPGIFSAAHTAGMPRVSLSSDVCATCHGEPLRHARYQQWQFSGHANYELAIDESQSGSCSRCHTVNGFLAWLPILSGDVPGDINDPVEVTWTADEAHPQTCVACHDPHAIGTESGEPNNATVRIAGNTPPLIAGFTAYGVGRGAVCMTCHNSRRGLRNDDTFDDFYGTSEAARAPHGSSQTDVLMGQNAYLVTVGDRGNHSFLADTCANCHMVATPPPPILSYNGGGTNHTFFAAEDVCAECHTGFDAETIQAGVQANLNILQDLVEEGLFELIDELTMMGNIIDLNGEAQITDAADIAEIVFGETRGRQSITVTFTDDTTFGPYRMNDVDVLNEIQEILGELYDFAEPNLIKAGWNWNLVNNDGSVGVHNPSYAFDVVVAGIEGLDSGLAGILELPVWYRASEPRTPGVH